MELIRVTRKKFKVVVLCSEYKQLMFTWCEDNWGTSSTSRRKSQEWRYGWASNKESVHHFWFTTEQNAMFFMLRWQ